MRKPQIRIAGNNIPFVCSTRKDGQKRSKSNVTGTFLVRIENIRKPNFSGRTANHATSSRVACYEVAISPRIVTVTSAKETSRRWEQGDDPSMVDFKCAEYSDGKTVADQELRKRILETGIRKAARATKTDSKTIMLISRGERVKPSTLAKVREFFNKRET
jgi:hypothetical protein